MEEIIIGDRSVTSQDEIIREVENYFKKLGSEDPEFIEDINTPQQSCKKERGHLIFEQ